MSAELPIYNERYKQIEKDPLGSGTFGKVLLCEDIITKKK